MKKILVLSLVFATIFGMTSQATNTPITSTQDTATTDTATAEATDTQTDGETETIATQEPAKETLSVPPVSPQVAKLIALYPNLVARIEPIGKVCFAGGECDITINVLSASADGSPRDGETIYKAVCHTCHDSGLVGAPKLGNAGDWSARIGKGTDTLYSHAINGFNAMPAKGGADIPDEEVQNAVNYMLGKVN